MREQIEILKQMKQELQQRIGAIDAALSVMEDIVSNLPPLPDAPSETYQLPEVFQDIQAKVNAQKKKKRKAKEEEIDMSTIPDFNPVGGGIRTDI